MTTPKDFGKKKDTKEAAAPIPVTTVPTKKESPPAEKKAKKRTLEVGKIISGYTVVKLYPEKDLVIWKTPKGTAFRIERISNDEHIKNCQTEEEAVIVCNGMPTAS